MTDIELTNYMPTNPTDIDFANIPLIGHGSSTWLRSDLMKSDGIQMALTHLVESDPFDMYVDNYRAMKQLFRDYIILDNSLIELGGAVDPKRLLDAAKKINADEIILPDVFQGGMESLHVTMKAAKYCQDSGYRLMGVAQGKTNSEFADVFRELIHCDYIHTIGIPKVASTLPGSDGKSRNHILSVLYDAGLLQEAQFEGKEIHLLGAWTVEDFSFSYVFREFIRSIDSVLPNWETYNGRDISSENYRMAGRTTGKVVHEKLAIPKMALKLENNNIKYVKELLTCNPTPTRGTD